MTATRLTLVVAMDRNRAIGRDGGLPWHLPADLKHFKRSTTGHAVVMGRRTFDEVGKPLPNRQNIVLSKTLTQAPAGCELARDLDAAVQLAGSDEVMIIGGGQIYEQSLARADRLLVTHVDTIVAGADTWFPPINGRRWLGQPMLSQPVDERHAHSFTVLDYRWRWRDGQRLCRVPTPGGRPVRLARPEFERMQKLLLDRVGARSKGLSLQQLLREAAGLSSVSNRGRCRWQLLRVKLELEAAGKLRRLPGSGPQILVLA